jgi:hypothetical protein
MSITIECVTNLIELFFVELFLFLGECVCVWVILVMIFIRFFWFATKVHFLIVKCSALAGRGVSEWVVKVPSLHYGWDFKHQLSFYCVPLRSMLMMMAMMWVSLFLSVRLEEQEGDSGSSGVAFSATHPVLSHAPLASRWSLWIGALHAWVALFVARIARKLARQSTEVELILRVPVGMRGENESLVKNITIKFTVSQKERETERVRKEGS